jgi:hypothetical protein
MVKPQHAITKFMAPVPGKFALTSKVTLQTRRAQAVDAQLATAIRRTCEASPQLAACYLLDARKPETGEMALIIAVTLADEAADMDSIAQQFQAMLRQFPTHASKTYIMSSARFARDYAGAEFYVRQAA